MWNPKETTFLEQQYSELKAQLVKEPKDVALREQLARCCLDLAKLNEAEAIYGELLSEHSEKSKYYYHLGKVLAAKNQWDKALERQNEALERWKDFGWAKFEKSKCLFKLGLKEEAKKLLREIESGLSDQEKDRVLALNLYRLSYDQHAEDGDHEEALQAAKKLTSLDPNDGFAYYRCGKESFELKHLEDALAEFQKADPILKKAYVKDKIAITLSGLGRDEEAVIIYRNLPFSIMDDYIHQHYGRLLYKLHDLNGAKVQLKKAITKQGNSKFNAHFYLGLVYLDLGLIRNAKNELNIANELRIKEFNGPHAEALKKIAYIDSNLKIDEEEVLEVYADEFDGKIIKYMEARGFGFIQPDAGSEIFFHVKGCRYKNISVGDIVRYEIIEGRKGQEAINVRLTKKR